MCKSADDGQAGLKMRYEAGCDGERLLLEEERGEPNPAGEFYARLLRACREDLRRMHAPLVIAWSSTLLDGASLPTQTVQSLPENHDNLD